MPKAIFNFGNMTRGFAVFPPWGDSIASVAQAVHDGDTVAISPDGHFSTRFLGIDTPEKTFQFPKINSEDDGKWLSISKFSDYLSDPFSDRYPDSDSLKTLLGSDLVNYLDQKFVSESASNHVFHAENAHRGLEGLINADYQKRTNNEENFRFFMAFAYEIMDGYGRFLCYLDRDNNPEERIGRITYNEKMLELGLAEPYFIWPNVNPFRKAASRTEAVPKPDNLSQWLQQDTRFSQARQFVKNARQNKIGIFDQNNPLVLSAFELRFLSRRSKPSRYMIDLSSDDPKLLSPTRYHEVDHQEDRLFINEEFVPLFESKGWCVE